MGEENTLPRQPERRFLDSLGDGAEHRVDVGLGGVGLEVISRRAGLEKTGHFRVGDAGDNERKRIGGQLRQFRNRIARRTHDGVINEIGRFDLRPREFYAIQDINRSQFYGESGVIGWCFFFTRKRKKSTWKLGSSESVERRRW